MIHIIILKDFYTSLIDQIFEGLNYKNIILPTVLTTQEPIDHQELLDTEKIESLILNGYNEKAAEEIFSLIETYQNHSDKELIYRSLSLLNLICDKSPAISERVIKNISHFINDSDSWIRLVSLEISYQIS